MQIRSSCDLIGFVGTPLFRRIVLWVAMETMHFYIARISIFARTIFLGHAWGPNEQFDTYKNLSWDSKVGPIRSQGINIIYFPVFSDFC